VKNRYIWLPLLRLIAPMEQFPTSYHCKWYITKTRNSGLHSRRRKFLQPLLHSVLRKLSNSQK